VALHVHRAGAARRLALQLLVEAPNAEAVAADAAELPNFGLEETYDHGNHGVSEGGALDSHDAFRSSSFPAAHRRIDS
jgi:hypothetical protein